MAFSDRKSLIPSFLYSTTSANSSKNVSTGLDHHHGNMDKKNFLIAAPKEGSDYKVEMYSPAFYAASTIGGILSCGPTHTAVTPLDLVKCNMQVYIYTYT